MVIQSKDHVLHHHARGLPGTIEVFDENMLILTEYLI